MHICVYVCFASEAKNMQIHSSLQYIMSWKVCDKKHVFKPPTIWNLYVWVVHMWENENVFSIYSFTVTVPQFVKKKSEIKQVYFFLSLLHSFEASWCSWLDLFCHLWHPRFTSGITEHCLVSTLSLPLLISSLHLHGSHLYQTHMTCNQTENIVGESKPSSLNKTFLHICDCAWGNMKECLLCWISTTSLYVYWIHT